MRLLSSTEKCFFCFVQTEIKVYSRDIKSEVWTNNNQNPEEYSGTQDF